MRNLRVLAILAVAAGLATSGCRRESPATDTAADEKLQVAATVHFLADIVANVGGDRVAVATILPPGASPHTFEPTPETIQAVGGAAAVFKIGCGLDDWVEQMGTAIQGDLKSVDVSAGIELRKFEDGSVDPHYWLSLVNGQIMAANVADALSRIDAANAEYYMANKTAYVKKLAAADAEMKAKLAPLKGMAIATFHDAWYYFAREYGLKVAATFKPFPGQQPSPAWLAGFIETVRRENIQWIFSEPQFSPDAISQVAKDLGVRVSVLDPEGGAGDYNGETGYIAMMKWNAAVLLETLGQQ